MQVIDRERLFRYSRGIKERKGIEMKRTYWQDLKGAFYLIWRNKWSFIAIGILLQFVVGIGAAALTWLFQLAVLLAGQANIDKNNLVSVMSHPLSFGLYHGLCFLVYVGDADPDFGHLPIANRPTLVL